MDIIPHVAQPEFIHQGRTDRVGPTYGNALVQRAGIACVVAEVGAASLQAECARGLLGIGGIAVTAENRVFRVQVVIPAGVPQVAGNRDVAAGIVVIGVGGPARQSRRVRQGPKSHDRKGLRAQTGLGDHIAGEHLAADAGIQVAGGRIVDLVVRAGSQPIAQVPGAGLCVGHRRENRPPQRLAVQLRIGEEEQLILDDPAANRSAKLVLPVNRVRVGKGVPGKVLKAWGIRLQVFKKIPMEIVGAGFG